MMISVLQMAQLPNIKVATLLLSVLCSAFMYDIFWVFLSPFIFNDSVLIAVDFFNSMRGSTGFQFQSF
nr:signal peptide peptidase-like 3 [Ipomoea batatas]